MRSSLRSAFLGLAVASALGVGCSPPDEKPDIPSVETAKSSALTTAEINAFTLKLNTAAISGVAYMLTDSDNWIGPNGCAACHRGFPLYGAAVALKNGMDVNLTKLDHFADYVAAEQYRRLPNNGTGAMWDHDSGYHMFIKGSFEFSALAAYNETRNNLYQNNLNDAIKWYLAPKEITQFGGVYNHRVGAGWSQYDGPGGPGATAGSNTWGVARNAATGVWTYSFPADGKLFASTTKRFFPNDWTYQPPNYPQGGAWYQMTGLAALGVSLYLNSNPSITAATRTTYTAFRDELLEGLAAGFLRDPSPGATSRLFYILSALSAAPTLSANLATVKTQVVNKLLAIKPAGVTGWGDTEWSMGASAVPTGMALLALCQAGVRWDAYPEVKNAIDWLTAQQVTTNTCGIYPSGTLPGCWTQPNTGVGSTGLDFPSMYAASGLACFGGQNALVTASNVLPADAVAGTAKLSPGGGSTQNVTFNLTVYNNGYTTNSFILTASGGFGATSFSFSPATLTVAANGTGVSAVTATFPANLPLSTSAPITVNVAYPGARGQVTRTVKIPVNIGAAIDPNLALATTTTFTSSATTIALTTPPAAPATATLTATVRANINNALVPGGSVTFTGPGFTQTVSTVNGVATYVWNTGSAPSGAGTLGASYGGYNSGVAGQSQYSASVSGNIGVTLTAPPPPATPGISGPADGYTSTNGNVTVTGTSAATLTITVRATNGANLGSVVVPAGGAFSVPLNLPPGVYVINAVASGAGGLSAPTTNRTITINPLPVVISSPANNTTTANGTVAISGTGYAGSSVTVKDGATTVGTFTVDAAGNWSGNVALSLGSHSLTLNQSISGATSANTTLNVGILPPAPAITSPANNAALPNGNNVIAGTGTVGTTITIFDNGVNTGVTGVVAANGQFNITIALGYGSHVLTTTATNNAGASAQSASRTVSVAPGAPVITAPAAASSDITGPFTFAGTGVAGASLAIYDNGALVTTLVIPGNSIWSYNFAVPGLGAHSLTATQTSNGQTSPASAARTVTVHNDSDGDTIYDEVDNCPNVYNIDQIDRERDGLGDVCDRAPNQADSSNNTTSATDMAITTDPSAASVLTAVNQNNVVTLPQGAWAGRSTLTLVLDPTANIGNIQIFGKASPSVAAWTLMSTYDLQLGANAPAGLANNLQAEVAVTTPRTSLANYAFRYKQFQVRLRESDGSITTMPHCASGMTVSATDSRCANTAVAYQLADGTNVDVGIKLLFNMKSLCTGTQCKNSCFDGIKNGNETDIDCGGSCGVCASGGGCATDNDCSALNVCDAGTRLCRAPQSCKELRTRRPAAGDGTYSIAPAGVAVAFPVRCDMTSDGGGYTMVRFTDASMNTSNQDAYANFCASKGLEIIVPRTKTHALAIKAWNGGEYPNVVNVFPNSNGANGLGNWHGTCRGANCSFYLADDNNNSNCAGFEPNGDNNTAYRIYNVGTGCSYGQWNDANNTMAVTGWVLCSANDK